MAAFGSSASATVESATSVTVTKPTSLATGDMMIAFCSERNSGGNFSTPSGWTAVGSHTASFDVRVAVFAKVAESGDAAASNFTFAYTGSNTKLEAVLYRVTGTFAGTANIYALAAAGGTEAVSDTFRVATGITPSAANSLLIMYVHILCDDSDSNAISAYALQTDTPTWTERHDFQDAGGTNVARIGTATATRAETTATGYFQAAVSTGNISEAGCVGVLLTVSDTANATHNATVIDSALSILSPTVTAGAQATVSGAVDMTTSVQAPTATGSENDVLWQNEEKPGTSSFTNIDKP